MTPTTLTNMWVCTRKVFGEENYDHSTIRHFKEASISTLLDHHILTWEEAQDRGWRCIKVDITFNPK